MVLQPWPYRQHWTMEQEWTAITVRPARLLTTPSTTSPHPPGGRERPVPRPLLGGIAPVPGLSLAAPPPRSTTPGASWRAAWQGATGSSRTPLTSSVARRSVSMPSSKPAMAALAAPAPGAASSDQACWPGGTEGWTSSPSSTRLTTLSRVTLQAGGRLEGSCILPFRAQASPVPLVQWPMMAVHRGQPADTTGQWRELPACLKQCGAGRRWLVGMTWGQGRGGTSMPTA